MINFEEKIKNEKIKLNKMIEDNNCQLNSEIILQQSKKVDRLIVIYQRIKQHTVEVNEYKECRSVISNIR